MVDFVFFVGDDTIGVGLHILAEVTGPWRQPNEPYFLTQYFWKQGYNPSP